MPFAKNESVYLCDCGCGQATNRKRNGDWNRYINRHARRGADFHERANALRPFCRCGCGNKTEWSQHDSCWNVYLPTHNVKDQWKNPAHREMHSRKAKAQFGTPEAREASRDRLNELWQNPEFCRNVADAATKMCKERWQEPEFREMMTEQARKTMTSNNAVWWQDDEYRGKHSERQSKMMKTKWKDPAYRDLHIAKLNRVWEDPEQRKRASLRFRALWKDPVFVKKMMELRGRRPNGLESLFDDLTTPRIAYVGDGTFFKTWPNGRIKNPDFRVYDKDGNPVKMIVELFGDYWHKGDDVQLHMEMWHRIGYSLLVIWEHELHEDQERILDLVSAFIGEEARVAV